MIAAHTVAEPAQQALNRLGLRYFADGIVAATFSGLELFFVLSAMLMLAPYLRGGRTLNVRSYLSRRAQRVWPAFVGALVFGGVVIFVARAHLTWYSRQVLPHFSLGGWAAQLGIVNFGWTNYNGAWWSLTLEVVFYVLVPALLVVMAAARSERGASIFFAVVVAASLSSLLWAQVPSQIGPHQMVALAFEYLPSFLLGIVIARFDLTARHGAVLTGVGTIFVLVAIGNHSLNVHAAFAPFWAGVAVLSTHGASRLRIWLAEPHLVWLGERTYSLYLVHFSVFYIVDYGISLFIPGRTLVFGVLSRGVGVPLSVLVAMILFWTVERRAARGLATGDTFWPWNVGRLETPLPESG